MVAGPGVIISDMKNMTVTILILMIMYDIIQYNMI